MEKVSARTDTQKRLPRFRRVEDIGHFEIVDDDVELLSAIGRYRVVQSIHLDALFPHRSRQKLRRRLQRYFHAGLIARPRCQISTMLDRKGSQAIACTLTRKGAALITARSPGIAVRLKADDTKQSQLAHTLGVTDALVALELGGRRTEYLSLVGAAELVAAAPEATREASNPHEWRVEVRYQGARRSLTVRPDGITAVRHRVLYERGQRSDKNLFLEVDRGTTPIIRPELYQSSILRKLLAYSATWRADIHKERYGFDNMRVATVTESAMRLEHMIAAVAEHAILPPALFLFTTRAQLLSPDTNALTDAIWLNGAGTGRALVD